MNFRHDLPRCPPTPPFRPRSWDNRCYRRRPLRRGVSRLRYRANRRNRLLRLLVGVAAGTLLTAPWLNWRQRTAALAVVVGIVGFLFGVYGGAVTCHEAEYGVPTTDHGIEYDWWTNTLRFGENVDGENYRCQGTPNRTALLTGYALTSAGALELLT